MVIKKVQRYIPVAATLLGPMAFTQLNTWLIVRTEKKQRVAKVLGTFITST